MKAKVILLKTSLLGRTVPDSACGHAGRKIEHVMIHDGFKLDTVSNGVDIPGLETEIKSRNLDAVSAHTVGRMSLAVIKKTTYRLSSIFKKIQRQFRVGIKHNVVVKTEIVDFSWDQIQDRIEQSYEAARLKIINGETRNYISGGHFGFFERTAKTSNSYQFRITNRAMKQLESMAKSNAKKLFSF